MLHPQMRCLSLTSRSLSLSPHSGRAAVWKMQKDISSECPCTACLLCVTAHDALAAVQLLAGDWA